MEHTEKYLQAKWVTENPKGYYEHDVIDAKRYCNAYLEGYNQALSVAIVSGLFEFSKFLNDNFEYFCNNIEVGDVYKCKRGRGLHSEKEVYDEYLRSK